MINYLRNLLRYSYENATSSKTILMKDVFPIILYVHFEQCKIHGEINQAVIKTFEHSYGG